MNVNADFNRGEGDPAVGKELKEFFLFLLGDKHALRKYYDRGEEGVEESPRDTLIRERQFKTDAGRLLREGTLKEIEEHILAVEGSYSKPLTIVWSL
jgi:hypothetical protein